MPLLVTQRDRSFIAASDYQKLYGTFLHNQYLLDMSKSRDLYTNGRSEDAEREDARDEGEFVILTLLKLGLVAERESSKG